MKKFVILLLFSLNILILNGCTSQNNPNFDTVIFYSPHADDEVLSMGASILRAKKADKEVVVVLLSKGLASSAFHKVNQRLTDEKLPSLSITQFGEARVREFRKSVLQLGVAEDNIHILNLPDGEFSSVEIEKIMEDFSKKYPNAEHHAMSYNDPHKDHAATGQALKDLIEAKKITYGIYHIPIQEFDNIDYDEQDKVPFFSRNKYRKALDAYGVWSPKQGFYSIGQDSVTDYFTTAEENLSSRWHY